MKNSKIRRRRLDSKPVTNNTSVHSWVLKTDRDSEAIVRYCLWFHYTREAGSRLQNLCIFWIVIEMEIQCQCGSIVHKTVKLPQTTVLLNRLRSLVWITQKRILLGCDSA